MLLPAPAAYDSTPITPSCFCFDEGLKLCLLLLLCSCRLRLYCRCRRLLLPALRCAAFLLSCPCLPPPITGTHITNDELIADVRPFCPSRRAVFFFIATKSFRRSSCLWGRTQISLTAFAIDSAPRAPALTKVHTFLQFIQPVTACNFKPNLARIVLATHTQETVRGCEVRGRQHVKRLHAKW